MYRRTIAGVMVLLYVMILITPFSVHSRYVAHAITGECSGDCEIDGCSLESRSNHTCCCVMKKQQAAGAAKVTAGGCCAAGGNPVEQNDNARKEYQSQKQNAKETVYRSGSSCGKGKLQILAASGFSELLLSLYDERITQPTYQERTYFISPQQMTSRYTEPPEPPPRKPVSA
ncbi:MAG: hypothetical protein ACOYL3_14735 [Desulfuromonadaceae bacterium]